MGRRRRPSRAQDDPLVVLIRPQKELESQAVEKHVTCCRRLAAKAGIGVTEYRTTARKVHGKHGDLKERALIHPDDAYRLYRQINYSDVLVCSFAAGFVSRDPGHRAPKIASLLDVASLVRHKALHKLVRGKRDPEMAFGDFTAWRAEAWQGDESDARILPLHMFATDCDTALLGTASGDAAFKKAHGNSSRRTDGAGLSWTRADADHSREVLKIAGTSLTPGMHWDVGARRGSGRISNLREVLQIVGRRNGYVNVYPNACFRVNDKTAVRRIWPKKPA